MTSERDNGTEVVGLMRTNTSDRTDQPSLSPLKSPKLERHISPIPQDDDDEEVNATAEIPKTKNPLKKLKNKITDKTSHERKDEPQQGSNTSASSLTGPGMPTRLKRNISSIPADDYDSESERPQSGHQTADMDDRHDSGISNESEFEVAPMLRFSSDEATHPDTAMKRPELERHISQLPQSDDREQRPASRLERTISHIPQDDYDSDD